MGGITHSLCLVRKCSSDFTHGLPIILLINDFFFFSLAYDLMLAFWPRGSSHIGPVSLFFSAGSAAF